MTKFWQVNEDPMYDEDGVLVDEDFDEDAALAEFEKALRELSESIGADVDEDFSPFDTVNS